MHAARGYRPDRPGGLPDLGWDVVQACWREDPVERPSMAMAVAALEACLEGLPPEQHAEVKEPLCACSVM